MLSCGGGGGGGHLYNSSTDGSHNGGGAGGWNGSGSYTSTNGTYSNLSSDSLFQVFPSFFQAIDHIDISMSVNGSQVEGLTGLTASTKKDVLPELHPDDVVNGTITIYLADGSTRTGRLASTTLSQNTRLVFIMEYRYLLKDSAGIYADIAGTYTSAAGINVSAVTWTKPNPAAAGTVLPIEKWQTNNGIPFAPGGIIRGVSGDIILTAIYGTGSHPAPVDLSISGEDTVEAGSTLDLSAVITDVPAGVSVSYSWTSSDTAMATVTAGAANPATAVVTGVSAGSITITLQAALSDGRTVSNTKDITVTVAPVTGVPIGELDTYLANLPANTAANPYRIEVTGLTTASDVRHLLSPALQNNSTKYVDLSATTLPVINTNNVLYNCTNLVVAPVIPEGSTYLDCCFAGCTSLVTAPVIPSSVTNMSMCFSGCTSLVTAPVIPASVTYMRDCFRNCINLSGTITINITSCSNWGSCFANLDASKIDMIVVPDPTVQAEVQNEMGSNSALRAKVVVAP